MAYRGHKIQPGEVSETSEDASTYGGSPDSMQYPGYQPQMYVRPVAPHMWHQGGEVPNNTDRGTEAHGIYVDSHVHPKDQGGEELVDQTSYVAQVVPEAHTKELPPVKVEVVEQYKNEIIRSGVMTVQLLTESVSAQGGPTQNGMTPIRILGKDPHRKRAFIYVPFFTSGGNSALGLVSNIVLLVRQSDLPQYGFSLAATYQQPMVVETTEELWIAGQNANDTGVVCVYVERVVNEDRLSKD